MHANSLTPRELFESKTHFEIPPYQRPYVWNEENQWAPLWSDIERVACELLEEKSEQRSDGGARHFLGAVVYESGSAVTGDVTRHTVIDGQQRMTTLQILIRAVSQAMREFDQAEMVEMLDELIMNSSRRFLGKPTRFKLYPSHSDRGAFERVMTGGNPSDHRLDLAFRFFSVAARDWLSTGGESAQSASLDQRANALGATIQDRLSLVSIDLSGNDDAQLIFETLNDRGTPLLKADLVKNWVFREGAQLNADVDDWAVRLWDEFDQPWWREEVQQGRLMRSRIDIFLQYWLTMKSCAEVRSDDTFRAFVRQSKTFMADRDFATSYLESLRSDADIFRRFAELGSDTPEGSFYRRVIERLELSVTTPIFLWLLSETTKVPADQRSLGLAALESWSV